MAALDWLETASDRLNNDSAYRDLGNADVDIAFRAGKVIRRVRFDAFSVGEVETINEAALRDVDVVIDMPARDWTNYLKRRNKGNGPSLSGLDVERSIVSARSPIERLKFDRFQRSIQALGDEGARVVAS